MLLMVILVGKYVIIVRLGLANCPPPTPSRKIPIPYRPQTNGDGFTGRGHTLAFTRLDINIAGHP